MRATCRPSLKRYARSRLIIAADDDDQTEGNPGVTKAREAAAAVSGVVALPDFGPDRLDGLTDFNDLGRFAGHDRVREIIDQTLIACARDHVDNGNSISSVSRSAKPEQNSQIPVGQRGRTRNSGICYQSLPSAN
jgi:putative DNA primase/helicase